MYSVTRCVLKGFGKLSDVFNTYTGIKEGACSSVILFIVFLDDIIDNLKRFCNVEPILNDLHCLLHADDTLLISTNRDQFTHKCNVLLKLLADKKMKLNYSKSGYMIINGGPSDLKSDLKLDIGWLEYNSVQKYLGSYFTDSGVLLNDVSYFVEKKYKEVNVKLASFLVKNPLAPVPVKLKVTKACVDSALTYSCEAWSDTSLNSVEVLHRKSIKMVLGVTNNSSNDIIYTESGIVNLKPMIYKRQLKYFRKLKDECISNPNTSIAKIFLKAYNDNTPFIRRYKKLDAQFITEDNCYDFYETSIRQQLEINLF